MSITERNTLAPEMPIERTSGISRIHDKWGKAAVAGFQPVPDLLLKHQATLELTPTDMTVLLNILMHWWYPEQMPYPRSTTISKRMGVAIRTVQRSIHRMEELGLITRVSNDNGPTFVNPEPLVDRLSELAENDKDYLIRSKNREFDVA